MIDNGLRARIVLCKMFDIEERDIVFMQSRESNKVKARRFYNYYLWRFKMVKHNDMKIWIDGLHHSSSIYHCRLMEKEIDIYRSIRKEFITFLWYADRKEWEKLKIDMAFPITELNNIDYKKQYVDIINLN